jgi:peptide/nickel transport system substrate-binding protein
MQVRSMSTRTLRTLGTLRSVHTVGASSRRSAIRTIVACAAAGLSSVAAAAGTQASAQGTVTLTVGVIQDLDSPNVTAGFLVSSFELWNLQYATLTDKAAADFAIEPGLAESWVSSNDGLTYTYTLREGLRWSDGKPLTAEDVAWTINTSRDQEWVNHSATTVNLDATVIDDRTVEVTSSVPDPKLPMLDVYIVPKHIWEAPAADDVTAYDALEGVGSGPYVLKEWKSKQSWTMVANPNYWGWGDDGPVIDQVVFRVFSNPDAMIAALKTGEIDAAHSIPSASVTELDADPDIVAIAGSQGGFTELAMNGMQGGLGDGHPALLDIDVRHAIAYAIDRQVLFDRVLLGLGELGLTLSTSADPVWQPDVPADRQFAFDPAKANQILDDAGYLDTNGDGIREMPDGSRELVFRYAERSESETSAAIREFITGWLQDIGIGTEVSVFDDGQLTEQIGKGEYDLFVWGWTPFVDPDPMLSYFTCEQVTTDPANILYNDANWCDPEYDELYQRQKVELDRDKRIKIVHEMLTLFYERSTYVVLFEDADTQAYRTDRFEGWLRQPADTGPVLFTNTSPTYTNLRLIGGRGGGDGVNIGLVVGLAVGGAVVIAGAAALALRRRSTADERE